MLCTKFEVAIASTVAADFLYAPLAHIPANFGFQSCFGNTAQTKVVYQT